MKVFNRNEVSRIVNALWAVSDACDEASDCTDCPFCLEGNCIFFASPDEWDISPVAVAMNGRAAEHRKEVERLGRQKAKKEKEKRKEG